ncbi:hypothetical protein BpHYR1_039871 [Brachionus plicatilis]|uniref:Uncharacterized protein n=1 Tax=Brachionus plicatilis TaxID=10195 RepID=A0A3M7PFQ2_BRAPC|nr:hypothetical protein BpHYR1_039871 [Brachionus plicatilis]
MKSNNLSNNFINYYRKNRTSFKVKLSADGTNVGRNIKLINFTFTVLNECDKAKTSKGNYTIGMAQLDEEYSDLKDLLAEHFRGISKNKAKENLGYKDLSLINFDYHFCLIDTLHLFLRITDKLLELFIKELCAFDNIDLTKHHCLKKIFDLLKTRCKVKSCNTLHTPFFSHVHQFQKFHGDIILFNLRGLEKLNDQTTIQYFRASNKREKTIKQLIQRRFRIDDFLNFMSEIILIQIMEQLKFRKNLEISIILSLKKKQINLDLPEVIQELFLPVS